MFASQETLNGVAQQAINVLKNLRSALEDVADYYGWLSGQTDDQLTGLGFSTSDISELRSGIADGNAFSVLYDTGLPPSTYPQPSESYVYGASQRIVIGPLTR